ncbi:hypothetical protein BJF79_10860 [Actinomadura sp. CNU-125]|nr:hypothetical protein BJF79_10860 [Actinomadura sp. CNU-125]
MMGTPPWTQPAYGGAARTRTEIPTETPHRMMIERVFGKLVPARAVVHSRAGRSKMSAAHRNVAHDIASSGPRADSHDE